MTLQLPPDFSGPVEIGRGRFGVVYRVRQDGIGRWIALKSLPASARKEAEAEARSMASIGLSVLPTIHGVLIHKRRVFVAEEWLQGPSLADILELGPLEETPFEWAAAICEGLASLHAAGLSHGDLKPANILCTIDGRIRLVDLGFAHHRDSHAKIHAGTPAYLAPELGSDGLTDPHAADLWALGIVLHELLCGVRPSAQEIQRGLPRLRKDQTAEWAELVAPLLASTPSQRPSARDVAGRIRMLQANGSPSPRHLELAKRLFAQKMAASLHRAALIAMKASKPEQAFAFLSEALEHDCDHAPSIELLPRIDFAPPSRNRMKLGISLGLALSVGLVSLFLLTRNKPSPNGSRIAPVLTREDSGIRLESAPTLPPSQDYDLPLRDDSHAGERSLGSVVLEGFPAGSRLQAGDTRASLTGAATQRLSLPIGRQRIDITHEGKLLHSEFHELVAFQTLVLRPDRAGKDSQ
ncbi:MAG: hypothetical protein RL318_2395 [Fibrobacterota bacterium]